MAEYISKEYLIAKFKELANDYTGEKRQRGLAYATAADMVALIKSADVQPVVYCKDCKYAQNPNDSMVYCTYFECGTMSQNDFCSQGERRVENG